MNKEIPPEPLDFFIWTVEDVGMWLEEINLGSYRQVFKENGVNGEYLEGMSMFTTEQILRFIRRCHMKWGDFITLCKELRRIKDTQLLPERKENTLHLIFEALALYLIARLHLHLPPAAFKTKLCCIHPNEVSVYVSSIIDQSLKSRFELPRDLSVSPATVACLKGEQKVRRPWWAPSCMSVFFVKAAKRNRQSRVVSLKLEP